MEINCAIVYTKKWYLSITKLYSLVWCDVVWSSLVCKGSQDELVFCMQNPPCTTLSCFLHQFLKIQWHCWHSWQLPGLTSTACMPPWNPALSTICIFPSFLWFWEVIAVEWVSSLGHLQYLVHCTITDNGGLQCQNIKWCKHKLDLQREPQSRTKQNIASTNESCVKWDLCCKVKIAIKVLGCVDSRYHPLMMSAGSMWCCKTNLKRKKGCHVHQGRHLKIT